MLYLFDANILVEAHNRYYGLDFVPGFWEFLEQEAKKMTLKSNDMVLAELKGYGDAVSEWVDAKKDDIFDISSEEKEIQNYFIEIVNHVNMHPVYSAAEKARFLDGADPWLIAACKYLDAILVTHEVFVPANSTKVKIPNIAKIFDVRTVNTFEMIRSLGGRFELG
jgi:hypothetical protein